MSEAPTPETGPLSVEQAIASLTPEPVEQAAPEASAEAAAEPEQIEAEASPAEEPDGEAETPADGEEAAAEDEPVVALDAPLYWSQEAKAKFAELSPELQAVVLEQEGPREAASAKAKAEAAEVRRTADAEMGKVSKLAEGLAEKLPQWLQVFESRWGTQIPDWVAYAAEHGAEQTTLLKLQYEQEASELQAARQATADAQALAQETYFKTEFARLSELSPELAHPETGPAKRTEVTQYLVKQGIDPQAIHSISAAEMTLAHKAMLYDRAQAALKAKPAPKPAIAPASRAPVRPAAAVPQSSQRSALQNAQARFNLNPSRENAEALILAKG